MNKRDETAIDMLKKIKEHILEGRLDNFKDEGEEIVGLINKTLKCFWCIDIVDEITFSNQNNTRKLIRLWAVSQIYYKKSLGEKAIDAMRGIASGEGVAFCFFITELLGQVGCEGPISKERLEKIAESRNIG